MSLYAQDLYGSLTLNRIPGGHLPNYYFGDLDRVFREAFADLVTVFASPEWEDLKVLSPALTTAFEKWLSEVN